MVVSSLIFDLDGTISDPSSGIVNCVNYALDACGYDTRTVSEISAEIGPPLDLMFRNFIPDITADQISQLVVKYRERFVVDGYAENKLYPQLAETIQQLVSAGFPVGVCTSKPEPSAIKVLQHFGLLHHFDFVSGGDVGIAKQSQLEELLAENKVDSEAVMIGDRGVDLIAAHNNKLRGVGVLWGFGERSELEAENAELILSDVSELLTAFHLK